MGLFRKKDKKNKKKLAKSGCLKKLGIFALFVGVFVIGLLNGLKNVDTLYGEQIRVVKEYIEAINEEVEVSQVITNPIGTYEEFQTVANESGFSGYTNLDGILMLNSTMILQDKIYGAILDNYIKQKDEFMSVGEFTVINQNTLKVVSVYNLTSVKNILSDAGDILPSKMYITTTYSYTISENENGDNQITVTEVSSLLNQLDQTKSDTILKYLKGASDSENINSFNIIDTYLFAIINDMAIKTESDLTITYEDSIGYFNFTK